MKLDTTLLGYDRYEPWDRPTLRFNKKTWATKNHLLPSNVAMYPYQYADGEAMQEFGHSSIGSLYDFRAKISFTECPMFNVRPGSYMALHGLAVQHKFQPKIGMQLSLASDHPTAVSTQSSSTNIRLIYCKAR
jgi:hypothetical protein